jgi:hypothetical protein
MKGLVPQPGKSVLGFSGGGRDVTEGSENAALGVFFQLAPHCCGS